MIAYANRAKAFEDCRQTEWDVLVIGGGATGAGILLDAATRGLKALLVEQKDYAWGTSSRSTKLIHGGLRYLKQLEIGLVREVGRERAILHANAPHLVHPEELLLPLIEEGSLGKYTTPVGLWMYEKLAGVPREERFHMLNREETLRAEPLLNQKVVKAGAVYREYRTDDSRLVTSLLKTATNQGATALNYAAAKRFLYDDKRQLSGVVVQDELGGNTFEIRARVTINAAGPWCDEVRRLDTEVRGKHLQLTKGVHLVFDRERFPLERSVYFDVPTDGRMVFAVRRDNSTYLGTTDTRYQGDISQPRTDDEDVHYLLQAANFMFPMLRLTIGDICSSWAGLRPLIHEEGKDPSELSRKDEVFQHPSGLISIAGGKLTGYRMMALRVMDMAMARLTASANRPYKDSATESCRLEGGDFDHYVEVEAYIRELLGESRQISADEAAIRHLVHAYGRNAGAIVERAYALVPEEPDARLRLLKAELEYGMAEEGVCTISDFIIRRSGRLYFDRSALKDTAEALSRHMALSLHWDGDFQLQQWEAFRQEYYAVLDFQSADVPR